MLPSPNDVLITSKGRKGRDRDVIKTSLAEREVGAEDIDMPHMCSSVFFSTNIVLIVCSISEIACNEATAIVFFIQNTFLTC